MANEEVLYISIPFAAQNSIPETQQADHAENLKNAAEHISRTWKNVVIGHWITVVADKSAEHYAPFVNPTYVSNTGRKASDSIKLHHQKLQEAERRALQGWDIMFGNGAVKFKEMVDAKKANYSEGALLPMGATGSRMTARGPVPVMVGLLAEQDTYMRDFPPAGTIRGNMKPDPPIIPVNNRIEWKAGQGSITRAVVFTLRGNAPSEFNPDLTLHLLKNVDEDYQVTQGTPKTELVIVKQPDETYTLDCTIAITAT